MNSIETFDELYIQPNVNTENDFNSIYENIKSTAGDSLAIENEFNEIYENLNNNSTSISPNNINGITSPEYLTPPTSPSSEESFLSISSSGFAPRLQTIGRQENVLSSLNHVRASGERSDSSDTLSSSSIDDDKIEESENAEWTSFDANEVTKKSRPVERGNSVRDKILAFDKRLESKIICGSTVSENLNENTIIVTEGKDAHDGKPVCDKEDNLVIEDKDGSTSDEKPVCDKRRNIYEEDNLHDEVKLVCDKGKYIKYKPVSDRGDNLFLEEKPACDKGSNLLTAEKPVSDNGTNVIADVNVCDKGRYLITDDKPVCDKGRNLEQKPVCVKETHLLVDETPACDKGRNLHLGEKSVCDKGRHLVIDEIPVCDKGKNLILYEEPVCDKGRYLITDDKPVCDKGRHLEQKPACVKETHLLVDETPVCDKGSNLHSNDKAVCDKGRHLVVNEIPVCDKGKHLILDEKPVCDKGRYLGTVEKPVCDKGRQLVTDKGDEKPVCDKGRYLGTVETPVCDKGKNVECNPNCIQETTVISDEKPVCDKGTNLNSGRQLVTDKIPVCDKGSYLITDETPVCDKGKNIEYKTVCFPVTKVILDEKPVCDKGRILITDENPLCENDNSVKYKIVCDKGNANTKYVKNIDTVLDEIPVCDKSIYLPSKDTKVTNDEPAKELKPSIYPINKNCWLPSHLRNKELLDSSSDKTENAIGKSNTKTKADMSIFPLNSRKSFVLDLKSDIKPVLHLPLIKSNIISKPMLGAIKKSQSEAIPEFPKFFEEKLKSPLSDDSYESVYSHRFRRGRSFDLPSPTKTRSEIPIKDISGHLEITHGENDDVNSSKPTVYPRSPDTVNFDLEIARKLNQQPEESLDLPEIADGSARITKAKAKKRKGKSKIPQRQNSKDSKETSEDKEDVKEEPKIESEEVVWDFDDRKDQMFLNEERNMIDSINGKSKDSVDSGSDSDSKASPRKHPVLCSPGKGTIGSSSGSDVALHEGAELSPDDNIDVVGSDGLRQSMQNILDQFMTEERRFDNQ